MVCAVLCQLHPAFWAHTQLLSGPFSSQSKVWRCRPSQAPSRPPSHLRQSLAEALGSRLLVLPVVSVLEVPGQLALGQDVMEWGLRPVTCCKNCNAGDSEPAQHRALTGQTASLG